MARLKAYNVPVAVNFTQASGAALTDLLAAKERGEMGDLLGVDIIVTYPAGRANGKRGADWLRFRAEGRHDSRSDFPFSVFHRAQFWGLYHL
jgi:hypothetical protein